jgi:hypothetical protein
MFVNPGQPHGLKLGIESQRRLGQIGTVKVTSKRRSKSEAELLDHATNNLLGALKRDMLKKEGRVDRSKLRKDGYSDRLLDRLEHA